MGNIKSNGLAFAGLPLFGVLGFSGEFSLVLKMNNQSFTLACLMQYDF
jgi:hypothetical protein